MILLDTNLLVYSVFADMAEHGRTREWIEARLDEGEGTVALAWSVVYAFVRLASDRRVVGDRAVTARRAWDIAAAYLAQPGVRMVAPGVGHAPIAAELLATPGLRSADLPDVEVAALAIEHGLVLATHDRGFRRFEKLRVIDPLAAP